MPLETSNLVRELKIRQEIEYRKQVNPLEWFNRLRLQAAFYECKSKVKGIFGGNRSGKTEEGAEYVLNRMLAKPKQRWWACAETFQDSVNVQQRKIWSLVPKNKVKYGRYDEVNGFTNRKLILSNGSILIFKSYDQKRESFQSDDVDGIWNDEEPPYDIYREQRMRLIDRDGEMLFTMTSLKGITDLVQDIYADHEVIESQYAPLFGEDLPRIVKKGDAHFFMLWTTENPYVNQRRLQHDVKLMTRAEIKTRIYGVPVNLTGKIYMKFGDMHRIPLEMVPLEDVTLYHVLDPHDRKPWAMAWFAIHKTGKAYLVDEYPNQNFNEMLYDDKTYEEYVIVIREKERYLKNIFRKGIHRRIIDPNFGNTPVKLAERQGGQSKTTPKEELERRGLKFHDAINWVEAGHLKVREALHYEIKDKEVIVQPKFFIVDTCENSDRHMSRYSRRDPNTSDGDVKDKVGLIEKYKDFCDLIRYFWMSDPKHITGLKRLPERKGKVY